MNVDAMDLNLLKILDVLLQEGHVTRAAKRLHLSQPAMSNALNRLREQFDDALFVRVGNTMVTTPRAESLRQPLRAALHLLKETVQEGAAFDPQTAEGTIRLLATDYVASVLLTPLRQQLRDHAPALKLAIVSPAEASTTDLLASSSVDIALVGPSSLIGPQLKQQKLFDEQFVAIARHDHPAFTQRKMTLKQYCDAEHVLVSPRGGSFRGSADETLEALGQSRNVTLSISQFLVAAQIISESDLVMTLGKKLANRMAKHWPIDIYELPFTMPDFKIVQAWHARMDRDPLHRWIRASIHQLAQGL